MTERESSSSLDLLLTGWDGGFEIVEESFLLNGAHGVRIDAEDAGRHAHADQKVSAPHQRQFANALLIESLHPQDIKLVGLFHFLEFGLEIDLLRFRHHHISRRLRLGHRAMEFTFSRIFPTRVGYRIPAMLRAKSIQPTSEKMKKQR